MNSIKKAFAKVLIAASAFVGSTAVASAQEYERDENTSLNMGLSHIQLYDPAIQTQKRVMFTVDFEKYLGERLPFFAYAGLRIPAVGSSGTERNLVSTPVKNPIGQLKMGASAGIGTRIDIFGGNYEHVRFGPQFKFYADALVADKVKVVPAFTFGLGGHFNRVSCNVLIGVQFGKAEMGNSFVSNPNATGPDNLWLPEPGRPSRFSQITIGYRL